MTLRNIDALFRGQEVAVFGTSETAAQQQLLTNLEASLDPRPVRHITTRPNPGDIPEDDIDLAVIMDARWGTARVITTLGERGCQAIMWATNEPIHAPVLRAAQPYNLRLLGARSAGVVDTRSQLNVSTLASTPRAGKVALITQSRSLAAGALDWALGRNIGFSWLACTGVEADIDVADLLDYAALDPQTRAVVLQIGTIRSPRKFMSAARAAARIKPVLVLQTQHTAKGPDPARSAAFARAGLVECENLGGLFDGLAALELLPARTASRIAILGNGSGVCALGTDAVRRQGLVPAELSKKTDKILRKVAPQASNGHAALNLGDSNIDESVAALRTVNHDKSVDMTLFVHSPIAGQPHDPMAEAVANADIGTRLLTVWMGLETARAARSYSARARMATFGSVDDAVRAVRYRSQHHRNRQLLTATPPPDPSVTADVDAVRERLARLAAAGVDWLSMEESTLLLTAYGIEGDTSDPAAVHIRIRCAPHPELGMVMSVQDDALQEAPAYGFAPLDALLANRLLDNSGISRRPAARRALDTLARALVRIGKMIVDLPQLAGLDVGVAADINGRLLAPTDILVELSATALPERRRLAMAPYPARMRHRVTLGGGNRYIVRAIHPADEPALLALLKSLGSEEIRLRFFGYIKHFSHDMAARMTQVDYDREVSLIASRFETPARIAGLATLIAEPDGHEAEFALVVQHEHTGLGVGRHLLDCLLRQAGARGIDTVYGDVLAHNQAMLRLARSLGFAVKPSLEDATSVRVEISTAGYGRRLA